MKIFKNNYSIEEKRKKGFGASQYLKHKKNKRYEFFFTGGLEQDLNKEELSRINYYIPEKVIIKEAPVGVTDSGLIVCVPDLVDVPSMSSTGQKGQGKTLLLHRLFDCFYNYFNYYGFIANDYQVECPWWTYPMGTKKFKKITTMIGENSIPLPIVSIYPDIVEENIPSSQLKFAIPYETFIEKIHLFCDLGNSEKYFKLIKEDLKGCKNFPELVDMINDQIDIKLKGVRGKIVSELKGFFDEGMVSFKKNVIGDVLLQGQRDSLIPALIKCRLIPNNITHTVYNKPKKFNGFMKWVIDDIIEHQTNDNFMTNKRLFILFDELNAIDNEEALGSIRKCVAQGRMNRIAFAWGAQNISNIDSRIVTNSKYTFAFNTTGQKDLSVLEKQMGLNPKQKKELTHLKKFEFMASTKDYFVIYDVLNNRKYKTEQNDVIKCRLIPPNSFHKAPGGTLHSIIPSTRKITKEYAEKVLKSREINLLNVKTNEKILDNLPPIYLEYNPIIKRPSVYELLDFGKNIFGIDSGITKLNYQEVKRKGWVISEYRVWKARDKDYPRQTKKYALRRDNGSHIVILDEIPPGRELRFDGVSRKIKLSGRDCENKWVDLEV